MSAVGWEAIIPAIQKWIYKSAGVDDSRVWQVRQDGPQKTFPYFTYDIADSIGVGRQWRKVAERTLAEGETLEDFPGEELVRKYQGHRVATLTIECFSPGVGATSAVALLENVVDALPLHEYDLDEAGAGIGSISSVAYGGGKRGNSLQPRAHVEVQLHVASEVQDYVTYIEFIQLTATESTTGAEVEVWVPEQPPEET